MSPSERFLLVCTSSSPWGPVYLGDPAVVKIPTRGNSECVFHLDPLRHDVVKAKRGLLSVNSEDTMPPREVFCIPQSP